MKKIISITSVFIFLLTSIAFGYDDVSNSQYKEEIYFLTQYAILEGNDGSFRPQENLTRAETARMLLRAYNKNDEMVKNSNESNAGIKFSDIDEGHWAYHHIYRAATAQMINGYSDGTVRPDENVTAVQFITMAVRLVGYDECAKEAGGYPEGYIKIAEEIGITQGMELEYDAYITREQAAKAVHSLINIPIRTVSGFEVVEKQNEDGTYTKEVVPSWIIADGSDGNERLTLFNKIYDNNELKE